MDLKTVKIDKLIPECFKGDPVLIALNRTLEPIVRELATSQNRLPIWANLKALTDTELDELANELNIPWYRISYPRTQKINIITDSARLQERLGTPNAMQAVLTDIFGGSEIQESWDYDGEPHHFKISVQNGEHLTTENYNRLMHLLGKIKRKSQYLDDIHTTYLSTANCTTAYIMIDMQNQIIENIQ